VEGLVVGVVVEPVAAAAEVVAAVDFEEEVDEAGVTVATCVAGTAGAVAIFGVGSGTDSET